MPAIALVGAGTAAVGKRTLITCPGQRSTERKIPAGMALDAVQHDNLTLERLRGRPDGHVERIAVGRHKGAVCRLHFSHKKFRDARSSSLRGPRDRRRFPGPDRVAAWPYRHVQT